MYKANKNISLFDSYSPVATDMAICTPPHFGLGHISNESSFHKDFNDACPQRKNSFQMVQKWVQRWPNFFHYFWKIEIKNANCIISILNIDYLFFQVSFCHPTTHMLQIWKYPYHTILKKTKSMKRGKKGSKFLKFPNIFTYLERPYEK